MDPPQPMDAHFSAILENIPEPRVMIYGAPPQDIWSVLGL
jgi:hypothetical protein